MPAHFSTKFGTSPPKLCSPPPLLEKLDSDKNVLIIIIIFFSIYHMYFLKEEEVEWRLNGFPLAIDESQKKS